MDQGQRFICAIAVFFVIAIIIMLFIQNIFLKGILLVLDLAALLRVLYQITSPRERERTAVKVCNENIDGRRKVKSRKKGSKGA